MSMYLAIKTIHVSCAIITLFGFLLRGFWMLIESPQLNQKLVKTLPHIIDTILLLSAIILLVLSGQSLYPFNWITLKIIILVLYIVFGTIALKRGKTKQIRIKAFLLSLASITSIFLLAILKPVL